MFGSLKGAFHKLVSPIVPQPEPVATQGYLVLGMHRSGTSCLTGLLETAGLWLGEVPRHNKNNPKGNLENKTIQSVNSAILAQFGGAWDAPPAAISWAKVDPESILSALEPYRRHSLWVLKDPRLVLTLEAWLPYLSSFQLIGAFRHPLSVARSLEARNKMPLQQGLTLWTHYNRRLLELHSRHDLPLVCFDVPAEQYLAEFGVLCGRLSLPFNAAAAAKFYEPEAVHHVAADEAALTVDVAQLYRELMERRFSPSMAADSPLRQAG